jgi:hypothetical protein
MACSGTALLFFTGSINSSPVVLYGCETWSLILSEEHKLRVFENRILRRIFGPKKDKVTGEWRKVHNVELNILYSSQILLDRSNRGE